ncbi:PAS domain-containing protein [Pseudorhodobacter sp. E13]|uniref:PAS-domain containing protein n=1 Tax=Pseudorhodobacter sp. E13 TaxID=2487931 RepID=UPI000F8D1FBD|nr:PAS-domain containing protein [Pseudorhodobacter sp. E13]RUS59560.1 PAS domain-containing protein [Pseudorhodobacter sp. E13]
MTFDPLLASGLLVTGVLSALVGVLFLAALQKKPAIGRASIFVEGGNTAEYLFDGEVLVDATPTARSLLPSSCRRGAAVWPGLLNYLEHRFPGASARIANLLTEGTLVMSTDQDGDSNPLLLRAEIRGGLTRITIMDAETSQALRGMDPLTRRAIREELEQLRQISAMAPLPIWRESLTGDVIWANACYLDLAAEHLGEEEDLTWPLPKLFDPLPESDTDKAASNGQRQKLTLRSTGQNRWFDLRGYAEGKTRHVYALPIDEAVKAEEGLRAFMQTLTKTFAHLSTGLAIFDQGRKLVLFNPALMDLTGLPPELLIRRPSLPAFFDAMREKSMIPEPRNYKSWRNQITDIEEAAANGLYEETWSLPSGQTYRVTGRPHPNGALALSFEDISTEMSQTRRYRADLELGQAVIDAVDAAIAVFSASGVLVMSNAAYAKLWGHDPAASLGGEGTISMLCNYWRTATAPTALWDRVEDYSTQLGERSSWQDPAWFPDGRRITCQFSPLAGGATMATFRLEAVDPQAQEGSVSQARKLA